MRADRCVVPLIDQLSGLPFTVTEPFANLELHSAEMQYVGSA